MNRKKIYGLIGYPLAHSFSKKYFTEKFQKEHILNSEYHLFPLKNIDEIKSLINDHPELVGLNVTIPYKQSIIPFLDEVDKVAEAIGAVNTIHIENGRMKGYNTDVTGFSLSIKKILKPYQKRSLILGTGGAAKAVAYVLKQMDIPFLFVSRNPFGKNQIAYNDLSKEIMEDHKIIINTTPLGMAPDTAFFPPIPYEFLTKDHLLFDLIYNPEETTFLQKGKLMGCHIKNGLEMLHIQAEESWRIWQSNSPQADPDPAT